MARKCATSVPLAAKVAANAVNAAVKVAANVLNAVNAALKTAQPMRPPAMPKPLPPK